MDLVVSFSSLSSDSSGVHLGILIGGPGGLEAGADFIPDLARNALQLQEDVKAKARSTMADLYAATFAPTDRVLIAGAFNLV